MSVQALRRESSPSITEDQLDAALARQRAAFFEEGPPTLAERRVRLRKLLRMVLDNEDRIVAAIDQDFGGRSSGESERLEILPTVLGLRHTLRHLRRWMRPERRSTHWATWPSRARVHHVPLGVVGIISPWNFPLYLALGPLTAALAAGNRAMLKPSELTPTFSALLAQLIAKTFPPQLVTVATGGPEVAKAFSRLPFDHLLFTGSTSIGRLVMRAASENLVPVTLELGGKSPAFIGRDFPLDGSLDSLVYGKLLNAGQTCVAPDYLLVHESRRDELVDALRASVARLYPQLAQNPDYTAIINERHYERLRGTLSDASDKGATLIELNPGDESREQLEEARKLAPTVLLDVDDSMTAMQDEIFGPIWPVVSYAELDEAIDYVTARPRPLAAYIYSHDRGTIERVSKKVVAGALSVNAIAVHVAQDDLPFGGVGTSGMGAYHGREGFLTFSHARATYQQLRPNLMHMIWPPYDGELSKKLIRFLLGK